VRRGAVGVEQAERHIADALARIGRVEARLSALGQRDASLPLRERVAEVLAGTGRASARSHRERAELDSAMAEVERLISRTFMGGASKLRVAR
jgi:hypothetical protein